MAQKNIGTGWTRDSRNAMNDNFDELFAARNVLQKQIRDIIIDSGTSDAETIQARGGEPLLNDRLNKTDQQLAETISQTEFDRWVATLLDGGPSIFYDTLSALKAAYPNGASGVALVRETDPSKIYVWNGMEWQYFGEYQGMVLKDGSITTGKLSFLEYGKNLFNKDSVTRGHYIRASDGKVIAAGGFTASDWISVTPGQKIISNKKIETSAFYNENKVFVSGIGAGNAQPVTIPEGVYLVRTTVLQKDLDVTQIEFGEVSTGYEEYHFKLKGLKSELDEFLATENESWVI